MGYEAARLLDLVMKGQPAPKKLVLIQPAGVTTRLSSDILMVQDTRVAESLRYIWENYTRAINAKTVAAEAAVSYQWLNELFVKTTGRTIAEAINLRRMEQAKRLLAETEMSLRDIAGECGFTDGTHICRMFRRESGGTPLEWRKRNHRA